MNCVIIFRMFPGEMKIEGVVRVGIYKFDFADGFSLPRGLGLNSVYSESTNNSDFSLAEYIRPDGPREGV